MYFVNRAQLNQCNPMKLSTINALRTLIKLNETKDLLLEIHKGYPSDTEFDDTIELIDAFMHGLAPLNEVIERQGMSNLGMREVVDHMNQRILHFYNLGKP
jgi:hypothetical protein